MLFKNLGQSLLNVFNCLYLLAIDPDKKQVFNKFSIYSKRKESEFSIESDSLELPKEVTLEISPSSFAHFFMDI